MPSSKEHRYSLILAFGLVYVFWGSTYLAISITVEHIPPAVMCALRFLVAGPLMLVFCRLSGRNIKFGFADQLKLALVGVLLLVGGNTTLAWAEQYVPSGLAALIIAITPIWFLIINSLFFRNQRVSQRGLVGIAIGIVGMMILLWPQLMASGKLGHTQLMASLSLLLSSFTWSLGSALSKKWDHGGDPFVGTGWQMTWAGVGNLLLAWATGEYPHTLWTVRGLAAVAYLIVFGSWVGYTAYIYILKHAPPDKASTYAYINPVIAVFLGWLILKEPVDRYILAGSVVIIFSVVMVTGAKTKSLVGARAQNVEVESAGD